jgi:hypothetical protein
MGGNSQLTLSTNVLSLVPGNSVVLPGLGPNGVFSTIQAKDVAATSTLTVDAQTITATPTTLLLNGLPIGTTQNTSSITNWSQYPAISTLQMNNNAIQNITSLSANTGSISSLTSQQLTTSSLTASTVQAGTVTGSAANFSTLWGQPSSFYQPSAALSTFNTINVSSIRGLPDVAVAANDISLVADEGANPNVAMVDIQAKGGLGGNITLTADTGAGGTSYGAINLVANGGTTGGIGTGGSINITANTPGGTASNASSKVTIDAAGVNVYAGAVAPVASLAGYLFNYGTLGINQCVGLPSVIPNFPGTLYQYATGGVGYGGIRLESPSGVELIDNTDLYAYRIYPYFNPFFVGTLPDLVISGRTHTVQNDQLLVLSTVRNLDFDSGTGAINGLSTINGQAYIPGGGGGGGGLPIAGNQLNYTNTSTLNLNADLAISTLSSIYLSANASTIQAGNVNNRLQMNLSTGIINITPSNFIRLRPINAASEIYADQTGVAAVRANSSVAIQAPTIFLETPGPTGSVITSSLTVSSINGAQFPGGGGGGTVSSFNELYTSTLTVRGSLPFGTNATFENVLNAGEGMYVKSIDDNIMGLGYISSGVITTELDMGKMTPFSGPTRNQFRFQSPVEIIPGVNGNYTFTDSNFRVLNAAVDAPQFTSVSSINGNPISAYVASPVIAGSNLTYTNTSTLNVTSSMQLNDITVSTIRGTSGPNSRLVLTADAAAVDIGRDTLTTLAISTTTIRSWDALSRLYLNSNGDVDLIAKSTLTLSAPVMNINSGIVSGNVSSFSVQAGPALLDAIRLFPGLTRITNTDTVSLYGRSTLEFISDSNITFSASTVSMDTSPLFVSSVTLSSINGLPISYYEPGGVSTISTFQTLNTSSLTVSSINGLAYPPPGASSTFSNLYLTPSTLLQSATGFPELQVYNPSTLSTGQVFASSYRLGGFNGDPNTGFYTRDVTNRAVFVDSNATVNRLAYTNDPNLTVSTLTASQYVSTPQFFVSTIINNNFVNNTTTTNDAYFSTIKFINGAGTAQISQPSTVGANAQPAGRFLFNQDLDAGTNEIWCRRIRVGIQNPPANNANELIFYDSIGGRQIGLQTANNDKTLRINDSVSPGYTAPGYLLDTRLNPPLFSTINAGTSTALMAWFPSTTQSTIGISTLSILNPLTYVAAANSLSTQTVVAANTPLDLNLGSLTTNIGNYTVQNSTITVPVAGTYEFVPSIQFRTASGGAQQVDFWMTKNGADLPSSASRISVANNAEQIGTVSIVDTATAGTQYGVRIASGDTSMSAGFFPAQTTPYNRPAIPSVIFNVKRLG